MLKTIKNYSLGDVKREMSRMLAEGGVNPEVRQFALEIASQGNQIEAVFDYVKANVKYQPDPYGAEFITSPLKMVEACRAGNAAEDCDGIALFIAGLLRSLGYNSRILLIDVGGKGLDHAVAQVYSKVEWINLDAASSFPLGWEEKYFSKVVIE